MKTVQTFTASIYVGYKPNYDIKSASFFEAQNSLARDLVRDYCNDVGLCVTFTPTEFIYTNGNEPGVVIGLINYPRFETTSDVIKAKAFAIAQILKHTLEQSRVSVVCTDKTYMLED